MFQLTHRRFVGSIGGWSAMDYWRCTRPVWWNYFVVGSNKKWVLYKPHYSVFQGVVLSHPAAIKSLSAGRVIIINDVLRINVVAVVLSSTVGTNSERTFTCLAICDKGGVTLSKEEVAKSAKITPVLGNSLFIPEGPCWHELVQVKAENVSIVTTKTIRVDVDKIVNDVKKRQQPRFRWVILI